MWQMLQWIWMVINGVFALGYFLLLLMALRRSTQSFWLIAIGVYTIDYVGNWGVDRIFFWGREGMAGAIAILAYLTAIVIWLFED